MELKLASLLLAGATLAGCATAPDAPLVFGAGHVFGVSIGASAAETGGEFVVGYKGSDIAVIPVSAAGPGGGEDLLGASATSGHRDSYSVFGQFSGDAQRTTGGASGNLGKFFATGAAAHVLAAGYARKMGVGRTTVAGCGPAQPVTAAAGGEKLDQVIAAVIAQAQRQERFEESLRRMAAPPAPKADTGGSAAAPARHGARLVFAQYDYLAVALDGSAVEQGVKLTLGYKDRNVAVVPVVGRDARGNLVRLESQDTGSGADAYSVLGRFDSKNSLDQSTTKSALNSFFSTGAASRTLGEGFKTMLCEEYQAPANR